MLQFSLLGSGSSGNAALVTGPAGKILVDCGLSFRQLTMRCDAIGTTLDGLMGVVITHEHADHVNGLGVLSRKTDVPIFMTQGTAQCLPRAVGEISGVEYFEPGDTVDVAGMELQSFPVLHDAAEPVSFAVRQDGCQIGFATDMGKVTQLVRERLSGSHALVLESNYCPDMLAESSYPPSIRARIAGTRGHLSNDQMADLLNGLIHPELRLVVAVHMSQENNTASRARAAAHDVLRGHSARLHVAEQDVPTPLFDVLKQDAALLDHIA